MSRVWDEKKISESPTGIQTMTFRTPVGSSNNQAMLFKQDSLRPSSYFN